MKAQLKIQKGWVHTYDAVEHTLWLEASSRPDSLAVACYIKGTARKWRIVESTQGGWKVRADNLKSLRAAKVTWLVLFGGN